MLPCMAKTQIPDDLAQALTALKAPSAALELWRESWPATQAAFQPDSLVFLSPDFVTDTCRTMGMSAEIQQALLDGLDLFTRRPIFQRLAWHCHHLLFSSPGDRLRIAEWPKIPREFGEPATLFYAYVMLSGVPRLRQLHRDRKIPEAITLDTLSDLELWIKEYRARYGMLGFETLDWLVHHLSGRLYKLGRLQFNFEFWNYDFFVFRHRNTRRVLMLTADACSFRADGQFSDADGASAAAPSWVSVFHETRPAVIRGNPILPTGQALPEPVELALADWELIFRRGDPALGVHIPATGPMAHAACGESFRQACQFFPRHFPDRPWRGFTCNSWLLDPQFEKCLPEASNIVRFLKEMYLFPLPRADATQHYERIFGVQFEHLPPGRIGEAPQHTSLQQMLVQHVKAGGRWRSGGSVLFPEDLDWGAQAYRHRLRPELPGKYGCIPSAL